MEPVADMRSLVVAVEKFLDGEGWDQPHLIAMLFRHPDGTNRGSFTPMLDFGPADLPAVCASAARVIHEKHPGTRAIGVAFAVEGWAASTPGTSIADAKAHVASYPYNRISDDPNRREIRNVVGLDLDGWMHFATRLRGEEEPKLMSVRDDDQQRDENLIGITPAYTQALRRSLRAAREASQ